jgi:diguanylate cyclase (GGDEF)-like protein
MKRGAARPRSKPVAPRIMPAKHSREQLRQGPTTQPARGGKTSSRSLMTRLAAEVERLAAQLAQSRAKVSDLETKIETDPLTELLNRRGFERELKRSLAYLKRYGASAALLFIDLDRFKPINDRHGHAAGDAVLKAVAATLTRNVRASDVIARLGGDEFVVLMWNVTAGVAATKAIALENAIAAAAVRFGPATLKIGASAGVVLIGASETPAELVGRADAAMYARKREKRGSPRLRREQGFRR